jgi:hypothetical protein
MEDNNNQQETVALVAQALEDFRMGMEAREKLGIGIGRRTTQIIRFGMTGMTILGLILFYPVFILTKDFSRITAHMTDLSGYMNSMNLSIGHMGENIRQIAKPMKAFPF